jgi:hypothetical protein
VIIWILLLLLGYLYLGQLEQRFAIDILSYDGFNELKLFFQGSAASLVRNNRTILSGIHALAVARIGQFL